MTTSHQVRETVKALFRNAPAGVYRGVRWEQGRACSRDVWRVLDAAGLGVCSYYWSLEELTAAVDAAYEREGEDVRLSDAELASLPY